MRRPLLTLVLFFFLSFALSAQLSILVNSLPDNTPYDARIFIAGSFNEWNSGADDFELQSNELGIREIELDLEAGPFEYKFTRGSWETAEGMADGAFRPNRTYDYKGGTDTLILTIAGWEGLSPGGNPGTAAVNVSVISEDFYMPQLERHRRIWIYLPPDYALSTRRYPVLYMQDGQNLFDRQISFSGEWEIDESLNDLFNGGDKGIIVVGIDNGGDHRIEEYTPWANPDYGGGSGELYVDFLVETLKPYIDKHYRSKPDQASTGIMGSSLGGLIALYAAVEYQDVFGKVGVFSPSLWFSPSVYVHISELGKQYDMRFFLLGGKNESATMEADMLALYNNLLGAGFQTDEVQLLIRPDGQHSEWFWAREFPNAYLWLFAEEVSAPANTPEIPKISLSPNPAGQEIHIEGTQSLNRPNIQIFSVDGKPILPPTVFQGNSFNSSFLKPGTYLFIVRDGEQILTSHKMVIAK